MNCPKCDANNPLENLFCGKCGADLLGTAPVTPPITESKAPSSSVIGYERPTKPVSSSSDLPTSTITIITILDPRDEGYKLLFKFQKIEGNELRNIDPPLIRKFPHKSDAHQAAQLYAERFTDKVRNCYAVINNERAELAKNSHDMKVETASDLLNNTTTFITIVDRRGEGFHLLYQFLNDDGKAMKIDPPLNRVFQCKADALQRARISAEKLTDKTKSCYVVIKRESAVSVWGNGGGQTLIDKIKNDGSKTAADLPDGTTTTITILDTHGEGFVVRTVFKKIEGEIPHLIVYAPRFTYKRDADKRARELAERFTDKVRNCYAVINNERAAL